MQLTILHSLPTQRLSDSEFSITDDDTLVAAKIIRKTCRKLGIDVSLFGLSVDTPHEVQNIRADCIFNLVEWTGSDIHAAKVAYSYLDRMGIPYTGADWKGYLISSEKTLMKSKFEEAHVPTPKSALIPFTTGVPELPIEGLVFPLIVKLASDHCSIGLDRHSVVTNKKALLKQVKHVMNSFRQDILVEEFIAGREFQVGALERDGKIIILPYMEIGFEQPDELNFLTFGGRWDDKHPDFQLSWSDLASNVPASVKQTINTEATKIFSLFGIHDYARFDIRVRDSEVFFLEVNANPGIDDTLECGVTFGAHHAGINFSQMIQGIIESAMKRKPMYREEYFNSAGIFSVS